MSGLSETLGDLVGENRATLDWLPETPAVSAAWLATLNSDD